MPEDMKSHQMPIKGQEMYFTYKDKNLDYWRREASRKAKVP